MFLKEQKREYREKLRITSVRLNSDTPLPSLRWTTQKSAGKGVISEEVHDVRIAVEEIRYSLC